MVRVILLFMAVFIFSCGEDIENITQEMLDYSDGGSIDILRSESDEFLLDRFVEPVEVREVGAIMTIEGYLGKRVPKYPSYMIFISKGGTKHVTLLNIHYQGPDIVVRVKGRLVKAGVDRWAGDMEISSMEKVMETEKLIKAVDEHWAIFAWKLIEEYDLPDKDLSLFDPLWDAKKKELIIFRNVGKLVYDSQRNLGYVACVKVYYFVNSDAKISKILLVVNDC